MCINLITRATNPLVKIDVGNKIAFSHEGAWLLLDSVKADFQPLRGVRVRVKVSFALCYMLNIVEVILNCYF